MKSNEIIRRPPLLPGSSRFELVHEDAEGNVLDYRCQEGLGHIRTPAIRNPLDMPIMPFLGPVGKTLIYYPTVGHNKFASTLAGLTGWTFGLGIGSGAELLADIGLSSEVTTYGGARASITPTYLGNVITFSHQWTFLTGANFVLTEAAVFLDGVMMIRNKYSETKVVVPTHKILASFTSTE